METFVGGETASMPTFIHLLNLCCGLCSETWEGQTCKYLKTECEERYLDPKEMK
jgi:hypothetical protein